MRTLQCIQDCIPASSDHGLLVATLLETLPDGECFVERRLADFHRPPTSESTCGEDGEEVIRVAREHTAALARKFEQEAKAEGPGPISALIEGIKPAMSRIETEIGIEQESVLRLTCR